MTGTVPTYRELFSHVVDVVEAVGATILVLGGVGAFVRYVRDIATQACRRSVSAICARTSVA